jgi:hypothetical protein
MCCGLQNLTSVERCCYNGKLGCHNLVTHCAEGGNLLGHDAALLSSSLLQGITFKVEESRNWTAVHYLPSDTVSHLRIMNSNTTVRLSVLMVNCAGDGNTYHAVW